jgi:chromosome partitioning protein
VDFDPQGSLSVGLGVNPHTLSASIYNLLLSRDTSIDDVIDETNVAGLDILPSNIDLSAAEIQLVSEVAREQTLVRLLEAVRSRYDVILIDCAPSLGLLTINALTAADRVIMPLECEFFALRGIALLTDTIAKVQDRLNPSLEILGILGTMYDPRTLHSREVLERVVEAFGEQVFHTVIRRTVKFPETTVAGEPITTYAPTSPGAEAYRNLGLAAASKLATEQPGRHGSGRIRHEEKITVYVSAEELLALEQARLTLRAQYGMAVDRGRIVREAIAAMLADLEASADDSELVRRLSTS